MEMVALWIIGWIGLMAIILAVTLIVQDWLNGVMSKRLMGYRHWNKTYLKFKIRKAVGRIAHFLTPHYGTCEACGIPWSITNGHVTRYTESSGCFPLCEYCWSDMPKIYRMEKYKKWFNRTYCDTPARERVITWNLIEQAVKDGK